MSLIILSFVIFVCSGIVCLLIVPTAMITALLLSTALGAGNAFIVFGFFVLFAPIVILLWTFLVMRRYSYF